MKVKHLFLGVGAVLCGGAFCTPVFATSYTREVEVEFNFNSTMNVTIDTADIEILDLAPGTSADSNIVGFTVSTNNIVGYTASATVGWSGNTTTNMTHTNGTNTFASIATDADLPSLTTDNTWGYATSTDNGTSWSNFSGLPLYTDDAKQIAYTDSPANDTMKFKINAKASTSQPSGDYKNKINFIIVANVPPRDFPDIVPSDGPKDPETGLPTIQSINEDLCDQVEAYDTQFLVTDIRDHKNYWISKLRDGYCWMTQNLDLNLDSTKTYTSTNTDLGWNGLGYTSTSWQPSLSTIPSTDFDSTTKYIYGWQASSSDPYSVDVGDLYWDSNTNTIGETPDPVNGTHSHVGNNYNFIAATANNSSIDSPYSNQPNSICPTNWGLPPIGQERSMNDLYQYYGNTTATGEYYLSAPLYFVISGHVSARYDNTTNQIVGYYASPWSSTWYWYNAKAAMELYATAVSFSTPDVYMGHNIRCRTRAKDKFTVNFDANNGDGNMSAQKISYGSSAALTANTFTRSGYYFNGWNTAANGTGTGYGNRGSYSAPATNTTTSVTLYAQWVEDTGQGSGSVGKTLQDAYEMAYVTNPGAFQEGDNNKHGLYVPHKTNGVYDGTYFEATQASDYEGIPANDLRFAIQDIDMGINGVKICDYATVIGSEAYVLDLRDYKSYWIAKLKDGKCWMTQNLDLNLETTPTSVAALTSLNTDLNTYGSNGYDSNNGYSIDANNVITWTPERATVKPSSINSFGSIIGWGNDYYDPFSVDTGDWYWTDTWYSSTQANNYLDSANNGAGDKFSRTPFKGNGSHGHVGNYYNWAAAIASNGTSSITENTYDNTANSPQNSICPKGWRLPIITSYSTYELGNHDFYNLVILYNNVQNMDRFLSESPFYHVHAGFVADSRLNSAGVGASYWSNVVADQTNAYYFGATTTSLTNVGFSYRLYGNTVRCIAR